MPLCAQTFRTVCGGFLAVFVHFMYKRVQEYRKNFVSSLKIRSFRLSFAVVFLIATLLRRSGDVELNPGPKSNPSSRQTKLQMKDQARSLSVDSMNKSRADEDSEREPSLRDVMRQLTGMQQDMNQRFDTVNGHFDSLNDSVTGLREEVTQLAAEVEEMKKENEQLRTENQALTDRLDETEKKLDDLEGRSKRNNLIFRGLKKQTSSEHESWDDCENLVKDMLRDQLKINDNVQFDRVHRLGNDTTSPIIARFTNFKDKQRVLKEKRKLKDSEEGKTIFIGEDFTKSVRDTRRKLVPFLKEAKADRTKKAFMVYDHLVIDGKKFYYDPATNNLKGSR